MGRIRTIKPEFFRHEKLFEVEQDFQLPLRLAFAGLFTCCDRDGRFRWRPRQLKLDILPYDDIDFSRVLDALATRGFIVKYEISGELYGCISSWHKHQHINHKEMPSDIPAPDPNNIIDVVISASNQENPHRNKVFDTCNSRVSHACSTRNQSALKSPGYSRGEGEREKEGNMEEEGKGNGKEGEREMNFCVEPLRVSTQVAHPPPVITIPLHDKTEFGIHQVQIDEWQELYPAVNVLQALRNIRAWNLANANKRKTKSGILRHINAWLAKEQNKGGKQSSFNSLTLFEQNLSAGTEWLEQSQSSIIDGEVIHET